MEKIDVRVNYKNSGVSTLKTTGIVLIVLGVISSLVAVISFLNMMKDEITDGAILGVSFASAIFFYTFGAISIGLSGIARSLLYQRMALEEKYYFIE